MTARIVVGMGIARAIGQKQIQLVTEESWRSIKCRIRGESLAELAQEVRRRQDSPWGFHFPYNAPLPYHILQYYERGRAA